MDTMTELRYVLFGFEWSANTKDSKPEICRYKVLKVRAYQNSWITTAINTLFLSWKETTEGIVFAQVFPNYLPKKGTRGVEDFIKNFRECCNSSWYCLTREEYDSWVEWSCEAPHEVELGKIDLTIGMED
jgi:hypothetical protein